MDIIVTALSTIAAMVVIALGLVAHTGVGSAMAEKLDRILEQRFAARAIIIDADNAHKRRRA